MKPRSERDILYPCIRGRNPASAAVTAAAKQRARSVSGTKRSTPARTSRTTTDVAATKKSSRSQSENGQLAQLSELAVALRSETSPGNASLMLTLLCATASWLNDPFQNSDMVRLRLLSARNVAIEMGADPDECTKVAEQLFAYFNKRPDFYKDFMG